MEQMRLATQARMGRRTGFEPATSGATIQCSTNCATVSISQFSILASDWQGANPVFFSTTPCRYHTHVRTAGLSCRMSISLPSSTTGSHVLPSLCPTCRDACRIASLASSCRHHVKPSRCLQALRCSSCSSSCQRLMGVGGLFANPQVARSLVVRTLRHFLYYMCYMWQATTSWNRKSMG